MALNAYLYLQGESQGQIEGDVKQVGREGSILTIAFSHGLAAATDGRKSIRAHEPVTCTKPIDKATPLLGQAWANNETMTRFQLDFWRPSQSGQEVQYYTVELSNARITAIRQEMLNNKYPENMQHEVREHVSFTYQKVIWTWQDGGITTEIPR